MTGEANVGNSKWISISPSAILRRRAASRISSTRLNVSWSNHSSGDISFCSYFFSAVSAVVRSPPGDACIASNGSGSRVVFARKRSAARWCPRRSERFSSNMETLLSPTTTSFDRSLESHTLTSSRASALTSLYFRGKNSVSFHSPLASSNAADDELTSLVSGSSSSVNSWNVARNSARPSSPT
eukprot:31532-Pelagococcus_subviridis.AAC.22